MIVWHVARHERADGRDDPARHKVLAHAHCVQRPASFEKIAHLSWDAQDAPVHPSPHAHVRLSSSHTLAASPPLLHSTLLVQLAPP